MKAASILKPFKGFPPWMKAVMTGGALVLFFLALALLPLPLPPYLDFQVLYQTNMALLRGISPYDHAGQVELIAQLAHVAPVQVYSLPFPYPPWYALGTLWLAWLPIEVAVRIWFGINLVLLSLSVWLLTDGWPPLRRLLGLCLAIFFAPVLGSLAVGQYGFPVLLGAALMVYACRHQKAVLVALAVALLILKPHVGAPIVLAMLVYFWQQRNAFARRAVAYCAIAGLLLFAAGFLADRAWPISYIRSLLAYRQDSGVATCGLCASLPAIVAGHVLHGAGLNLAFVIGALIGAASIAFWLLRGKLLMHEPSGLVAIATLIVLLASPYLLNYDFILLLIPFSLLVGREHRQSGWIYLAIVYALPFATLAIWGRQGNFIFPLCTFILLVMLYWKPALS